MTQDQMHQCDVYEVPCLENDYEKFDSRCREELALDVTTEQIINNSDFCTFIALDIIAASDPDDSLSLNEQLSGLHGKFGLYRTNSARVANQYLACCFETRKFEPA